MHSARIAGLLEPYLGPPDARRLTPDALKHISMYIDILQRWNSRINLTAIRSEEEIVTRHFGESLFAARQLFPHRGATAASPVVPPNRSEADPVPDKDLSADDQRRTPPGVVRVADVGSGAGFPGIPLKLWAPEIALTLIESNHKKATFLKEVTRALTLTDINIQATRAEFLPPASYDIVTLRAVERFETILPIAARLMATNGRLALLISSAQLSAAQSAVPDLLWSDAYPLPGSDSRILAISTHPRAVVTRSNQKRNKWNDLHDK